MAMKEALSTNIDLQSIYGGEHISDARSAFYVDAGQRALDLSRLAEIRQRQADEPEYPIDVTGPTNDEFKHMKRAGALYMESLSVGRHTPSGDLAIGADMNYAGNLGGGSPRNPLRVGGITH
ncbi:MAG: hypothetical protein ABIP74_01400 [Candidatus Saccharimonas sp.]